MEKVETGVTVSWWRLKQLQRKTIRKSWKTRESGLLKEADLELCVQERDNFKKVSDDAKTPKSK